MTLFVEMPTCAAIAWAVRGLSPVAIHTSSPIARSLRIATGASARIVSATATTPVMAMPVSALALASASSLSRVTQIIKTVLPCVSRRYVVGGRVSGV